MITSSDPVCFDGAQATPMYANSLALPAADRWWAGVVAHDDGDTLDIMLMEPVAGYSGPPLRYQVPRSAVRRREPNEGCQ